MALVTAYCFYLTFVWVNRKREEIKRCVLKSCVPYKAIREYITPHPPKPPVHKPLAWTHHQPEHNEGSETFSSIKSLPFFRKYWFPIPFPHAFLYNGLPLAYTLPHWSIWLLFKWETVGKILNKGQPCLNIGLHGGENVAWLQPFSEGASGRQEDGLSHHFSWNIRSSLPLPPSATIPSSSSTGREGWEAGQIHQSVHGAIRFAF